MYSRIWSTPYSLIYRGPTFPDEQALGDRGERKKNALWKKETLEQTVALGGRPSALSSWVEQARDYSVHPNLSMFGDEASSCCDDSNLWGRHLYRLWWHYYTLQWHFCFSFSNILILLCTVLCSIFVYVQGCFHAEFILFFMNGSVLLWNGQCTSH